MFKLTGKKIIKILRLKSFLIGTYEALSHVLSYGFMKYAKVSCESIGMTLFKTANLLCNNETALIEADIQIRV